MATNVRQQANFIEYLSQLAANAEFSQLVRLAERFCRTEGIPLRFKNEASLSFAVSDVSRLSLETKNKTKQLEIVVAFIGLIGGTGLMPEPYREYLLERLQAKDTTLLAFLDLFHDQLFHLLYRVDSISHFYLDFEQSKTSEITQTLSALAGQKTPLPKDLSLYFSGLLSEQVRSADSLIKILHMYFGVPIQLENFTSHWLWLNEDERSHLTHSGNNALSKTAILGKRVALVEDRLTIIVGPIDVSAFYQFLPGQPALSELQQIMQAFCGLEFDFDVKLLLKQSSLPKCVISKQQQSRLGWTSTLASKTTEKNTLTIKISHNEMKKVA